MELEKIHKAFSETVMELEATRKELEVLKNENRLLRIENIQHLQGKVRLQEDLDSAESRAWLAKNPQYVEL